MHSHTESIMNTNFINFVYFETMQIGGLQESIILYGKTNLL